MGGLTEKIYNGAEAVIRVVEQDIPAPDCREDVLSLSKYREILRGGRVNP